MTVAQKLRCRVERIVDHGEQVYTVELRPERPAPRFRPGQFLHLALDDYDPSSFWPESRAFSIASASSQRERLTICYSVRGRFTARMAAELIEGGQVWIKLPYGEFVFQDTSDLVFLAGGTGITAFTAFIAGLTSELRHTTTLFYGARQQSLLIYKPLFDQVATHTPQFRVYYFVEEPGGISADATNPLNLGQISIDVAWRQLRDPLYCVFCISGPPAMLKAMSEQLIGRGVAPEAIRADAWE